MENEIDLRPYIQALIQHWFWILGFAILTATLTLLISLLTPSVYEAKASLAIVRSRTDITFDPRIRTLSQDELNSLNSSALTRQDALVGLVKSHDVAMQVWTDTTAALPEDIRSLTALLNLIEGESEGDLIHILVRYKDAGVAARIANLWAQHYEQHVNKLYKAGDASSLTVVVEQVVTARQAYNNAQAELETFLENNRIATLQREIDTLNGLLAAYQEVRITIQGAPVRLQAGNWQGVLSDYYNDLRQIEDWLADARALREQVRGGPPSTVANLSNALALISLHGRVFGGQRQTANGNIPVELQLNFDGVNESVQPDEVDVLINVLETRRVETEARIEALKADAFALELDGLVLGEAHPINQRVVELEAEILTLEAQKEAEEARHGQFVQARDLAWETFQALSLKQAEEEIAVGTNYTEVRLASSAIELVEPVSRRIILKTVVAGFVGMAFAALIIFVREWWQSA